MRQQIGDAGFFEDALFFVSFPLCCTIAKQPMHPSMPAVSCSRSDNPELARHWKQTLERSKAVQLLTILH